MFDIGQFANQLKSKNRFWIAFTGDSITSCEWVHPNWREIVEYVLKKETTKQLKGDWKPSEWGIRGFNFAYDGATTADILIKLHDILLVKPDMVIALMGGNDLLYKISVGEHVENIAKIIKKFSDSGSKVVWCTSTPALESWIKNTEYKPYAQATMKIKTNENGQLIDMFNIYKKFPLKEIFTFISEENLVAGVKEGEIDPNHPNQLGNAYIAKVILKDVFSIEFNPEKYIQDTLTGEKYPGY